MTPELHAEVKWFPGGYVPILYLRWRTGSMFGRATSYGFDSEYEAWLWLKEQFDLAWWAGLKP